MAWRDTLLQLRQELAGKRAERQRQVAEEEAELQEQRQELSQLVASLGIAELLNEMNTVLLDGRGRVETLVSWEESDSDDSDEDELAPLFEVDEDNVDIVSTILSWEEGGDMEIGVDLGRTEDGIYLQVNGVDVRLERPALERALVAAFQEELEL